MATSLNIAGEKSLTNLEQLPKVFEQNIDLIIDEGEAKIGEASTIIRVEDDKVITLRKGPIKFER